MSCTTILVGKNASFDGSTMIARNDDSGSGHFMPKKFVVIHPEEQNTFRRRMDRKNRSVESGKRILSIWCFLIFTVHARAWSGLEAFLRSTEPMR